MGIIVVRRVELSNVCVKCASIDCRMDDALSLLFFAKEVSRKFTGKV